MTCKEKREDRGEHAERVNLAQDAGNNQIAVEEDVSYFVNPFAHNPFGSSGFFFLFLLWVTDAPEPGSCC